MDRVVSAIDRLRDRVEVLERLSTGHDPLIARRAYAAEYYRTHRETLKAKRDAKRDM